MKAKLFFTVLIPTTLAVAACSTINPNDRESTVVIRYDKSLIDSDYLAYTSVTTTKISHAYQTEANTISFTDKDFKEGYELWLGLNEECFFKVYSAEIIVQEEAPIFSQKISRHDGECEFEINELYTQVTAKLYQ